MASPVFDSASIVVRLIADGNIDYRKLTLFVSYTLNIILYYDFMEYRITVDATWSLLFVYTNKISGIIIAF